MDLVDKSEDESESATGIRRRARRRTLLVGLVGGTVLTAGVVGMLVAQPWAADESAPQSSVAAEGSSSADASGKADAIDPELSNRLMLSPSPEGFDVQYVNDPTAESEGPVFVDPSAGMMDISLFRGADATYEDGPWISVSVSLLDRFERANFQPFNYVDRSMFRKAAVGGMAAAIGKNFDESRALIYGPVNDGFAVSITAIGVPEAQLLAIAEEITLEEDGATATPVFGAALTGAGLEPFLRYVAPSWGGVQVGMQLPGLFGGDPTSTSIGYTTAEGFDDYISITNQPLNADFDMLQLARFVIVDGADVAVHGLPGLAGTLPEAFGAQPIVVWAEGGRLIVVTSSQGVESLVDIAESVAVASEEDWAAAFEQSQSNQGEFQQAPDTWLIAAGDLEDAATWLIEGGINDDGELVLCGFTITADGGSSSGCIPAQEAAAPSILAGGTIGFNGTGVTIVALGPLDEDLVLRYTTVDGDVSETQLRVIQAEWEYTAGALVPTAPGTAELIGADGRVIATKEFSADEFQFDANGDVGVAPVATAAPAQG